MNLSGLPSVSGPGCSRSRFQLPPASHFSLKMKFSALRGPNRLLRAYTTSNSTDANFCVKTETKLSSAVIKALVRPTHAAVQSHLFATANQRLSRRAANFDMKGSIGSDFETAPQNDTNRYPASRAHSYHLHITDVHNTLYQSPFALVKYMVINTWCLIRSYNFMCCTIPLLTSTTFLQYSWVVAYIYKEILLGRIQSGCAQTRTRVIVA
jgi:hypothetical protein